MWQWHYGFMSLENVERERDFCDRKKYQINLYGFEKSACELRRIVERERKSFGKSFPGQKIPSFIGKSAVAAAARTSVATTFCGEIFPFPLSFVFTALDSTLF
jgi:hypothetical protein